MSTHEESGARPRRTLRDPSARPPVARLCEDLTRLWVARELRYQRVAFPDAYRTGGAKLDGEVILAHGTIPGAQE